MKRRVLLVDDEVAVLLTLKAVLEISGYDVDTAASAREGRLKLKHGHYDMVITDMRMESEAAGAEVIQEARTAEYCPAVALLTAFPLAEEDWQSMGADKMLVKPMQTKMLLQQIERLLLLNEARLEVMAARQAMAERDRAALPSRKTAAKKTSGKNTAQKTAKTPAKRVATKVVKSPAKKAATPVAKSSAKKAAKSPARKTSAKTATRKAATKKAARKR